MQPSSNMCNGETGGPYILLLPPEAGGISGRFERQNDHADGRRSASKEVFMAGKGKIWGRSTPSTTCPFCGGAETAFVKAKRADDDPGRFVVRCCSCGAQGPSAPTMGDANVRWQEREDADGR